MRTAAIATRFFLTLTALSLSGCLQENAASTSFQASSIIFVSNVERPYGYFKPPQKWLIADPKVLAPRVKIGFIANDRTGFCPSLNLATEKVSVDMPAYLEAVKNIHTADRDNRWRHLGKIPTLAGEAQLTEIDTMTKWGPTRLLQMIFIKDDIAYILTAGALKEDFSEFQEIFADAFQSFNIAGDLLDTITDVERRESLALKQKAIIASFQQTLNQYSSPKDLFHDKDFQKNIWKPFQKEVVENFSDMGSHWQILILQSTQEEMSRI